MSHVVSHHSLNSFICNLRGKQTQDLYPCLGSCNTGIWQPQALTATRIVQLKEGRRNGRIIKMLYLGLILDIRITKYITEQMAVRKNRNYNKAHSNDTLSLHIIFQIQLALLLALCNMSTRIPCKSHNLIP